MLKSPHELNTLSVSNTLIFLSIITTLVAQLFPELDIYSKWGLHSYFLSQGEYLHFFGQLFISEFIHGGVLHLFMNMIFIYYFGNIVELMIGSKKFILFFIFITFFNGFFITLLSDYGVTVGISGFALAILSYYTLELKEQRNPEYKGGITAIVINIGIGFYPGISLLGHLFGAIGGAIFYYINRDILRKILIGLCGTITNTCSGEKNILPKNYKKD